jgi:hypothetical protein
VKSWKTIYHANGPQNQAEESVKVGFKIILFKKDTEGHFTLIKGAIYQEEVTIINLYSPNVRAPNFIKNTLNVLKSHMDQNTMVVKDSTTTLSPDKKWIKKSWK